MVVTKCQAKSIPCVKLLRKTRYKHAHLLYSLSVSDEASKMVVEPLSHII